MYHLSDSLFFGRRSNGDVRVLKFAKWDFDVGFPRVDGVYPDAILNLTIQPSHWASVVASVSEMGETGPQFRRALALHMEQGLA